MHTDTDRRVRLKTNRLRRICDDLAHERGLLRVRLAAIAHHHSGWRGPEAVELRAKITALTSRWVVANEDLRAHLQEHRPEPPGAGDQSCPAVRLAYRVGGA